ncbi:phytoene/squalene synthase family protein [Halorarum salinum]|uniref:Phytoene/squalene synthase family protein n=1 Tax=Halorarum salinum TaxID=2743089 RepID=A0A7D5QCS7_9EURY|nr:phytoene/squalene synthase family protein [Halobaculum salinum]QLG63299.1 phytoene/squalene synthase family protein [Halobaculum salinum]
MNDADPIARSKRIQRRTGRTFHFATRVLPERVRHPTYVMYAFFRLADEVVDDPDPGPPAEQRAELSRLRAAALGHVETADPVLSAFADVRDEFGIADGDVRAFLDAMASDVETRRYETYGDLSAYMDGSAGAVGRMMTAVMEPEDPDAAIPHATALGEAFQLTNFVRDVGEDVVERDRVYLPAETLAEHGATVAQVRRLEFDGSVAAAIRHELLRAESLYRDGVAGIELLPSDCRFAVLFAAVLYADHHRLVRSLGYDTLTRTPSLGTARKAFLLARTSLAWVRTRDPEAAFRRASAVQYDGTADVHGGSRERLSVP